MLIVLSGTSSSGKKTLARAMQALSPRPLFHLEADRFAPTLLPDNPTINDAELRSRFVIAIHEANAALGRSGLHYIVDGSLPTEPDLRDRCLAELRGAPETRVVAVRCSAEALRERERARGDRPEGWAEEQLALVYQGVEFDAVVDTTSTLPEAAARAVLREVFGGSASGW